MKITVQKHDNFTIISNTPFRDNRMSLKAMGLLGYMMSCSDDWDYSVAGLATVLKDGKDSIMSGIRELEKLGYMKRVRTRNSDGSFGKMEYIVTDIPEVLENTNIEPQSENPHADNPNKEKPLMDNPPQRKTNPRNNNINKDYRKKNNLSLKEIKAHIKKQISYDDLCQTTDKGLIDNVVAIMVDLSYFSTTKESIKVGSEEYPAEMIAEKLNTLRMTHIQYVLDCFGKHKDKIKNIKAYLQVSILNASSTMDAYYDAEVRHDMQYWGR